ncbi:MAG: right-handed parallel beta-helix repeat-containing protein [Saprospiraceae bacterium]|nr:right-handed parallel beta-helix repeat-containing protein [Saprospiraceae bacterium]
MKKILILVFGILPFFLNAQTSAEIRPAAKLIVSNATGSDPYVLSVNVIDDLSRFSLADFGVNDSVYLIDGSDLLIYVVTAKSGSQLTVDDVNNTGINPPTGQGAIVKTTELNNYPFYISSLRDDLRSMMMNRFAQLLDKTVADSKDIYPYLGGAGVLPSVAPPAIPQYLARNTVGELYQYKGTTWDLVGGNITVGDSSNISIIKTGAGVVKSTLIVQNGGTTNDSIVRMRTGTNELYLTNGGAYVAHSDTIAKSDKTDYLTRNKADDLYYNGSEKYMSTTVTANGERVIGLGNIDNADALTASPTTDRTLLIQNGAAVQKITQEQLIDPANEIAYQTTLPTIFTKKVVISTVGSDTTRYEWNGKNYVSDYVYGSATPPLYTEIIDNTKAIWLNPNLSTITGHTVNFIFKSLKWIPQKGQNSLTIIDFGADPTGVADATSSIQKCLNYSTNFDNVVRVPKGTFKISKGLRVPDGVKVTSENKDSSIIFSIATLAGTRTVDDYFMFASKAGWDYSTQNKNITIENLTLEHRNNTFAHNASNFLGGIGFVDAEGVKIRNVKISGFDGFGINFQSYNTLETKNNTVENCTILLKSNDNSVSTEVRYGINFSCTVGDSANGAYSATWINNIKNSPYYVLPKITNNFIVGNTITGGTHGVIIQNGKNNTIQNNNIKDVRDRGIILAPTSDSNIVLKNYITDARSTGIQLANGSSFNNIEGNYVSNVYGGEGNGIKGYVSVDNNNIVNNILSNIEKESISLSHNANNNLISLNRISNNNSNSNVGISLNANRTLQYYAGITYNNQGKATNNIVKDNIIKKSFIGLLITDNVGISNSVTRNSIENNYIDSCSAVSITSDSRINSIINNTINNNNLSNQQSLVESGLLDNNSFTSNQIANDKITDIWGIKGTTTYDNLHFIGSKNDNTYIGSGVNRFVKLHQGGELTILQSTVNNSTVPQAGLRVGSSIVLGDTNSIGIRLYNLLPTYLPNSVNSFVGETNSTIVSQSETNSQNLGNFLLGSRSDVPSAVDLYYSKGNGVMLGQRTGHNPLNGSYSIQQRLPLKLNNATTTERNLFGFDTNDKGVIFFNTTQNVLQIFNGTEWIDLNASLNLKNNLIAIPSISGYTQLFVDVTVTGAAIGNSVTLNPRSNIGIDNVAIASCFVVSANTVRINFLGTTSGVNGGVTRNFDINVNKN